MAGRIKKVQIIRIKAFGGKLSDKQEVLAEVPSIKMAEAAVREWQQLGHQAQQSVLNTSEKTPAKHYGRYLWEQNHVEDESFGYDLTGTRISGTAARESFQNAYILM